MMSPSLRVTLWMIGLLFSGLGVWMVARRHVNERNVLVWLGGIFTILILTADPGLLNSVAYTLGVEYPPSLLFLIAILTLLGISLYQASQISILRMQVQRLSQSLALMPHQSTSPRDQAEETQSDEHDRESHVG